MFNKNVFTQKDPIADMVKPMLEAQAKAKMEELKGNQSVLDKNKNNKLDSQDFKILRGEKKVNEEQVEESSPFDWKKPREPEVKGGAGVKKGRAYGGAAQKSKPEQETDDDKKMKKEEVEQVDEDRYDDMLNDMLKGKSGQRLLKKHSAEVKKSKDIESGKALQKHVKKNPGVLKTYSNAVKRDKKLYGEEVEQVDEASYSAKAARAGKDIGKPGKMFGKIAKKAAARYGSMVKGKKVAGALLAKLRKEETDYEPLLIDQIMEDTMSAIEQLDELKKATVKSYIAKKMAKLPGKNPKKDQENLMGAHHRVTGVKPTSEGVEQVDERTLTPGETAEKERIVKGMKKSAAGFKARYGERAKSVMYATATKAAKKD